MTAPGTLAEPGPVKVNVEVLMVAGFIALLNVALIMAVPGHTPALPFGGVTETTVGAVVGEEATPFLSGSPHPTAKLSNRRAVNQILCLLHVRIRASSSRPNYRRIANRSNSISGCLVKIEQGDIVMSYSRYKFQFWES